MKWLCLALLPLLFWVTAASATSVTAHRGGGAYAPENTLIAIDNALRLNVDIIEMDLRMTADAIPILFHDQIFERVSNCQGIVIQTLFAAMQHCDAAYKFYAGLRYGSAAAKPPPLQGKRLGIASIELALGKMAASKATRILIEIKPASGQADNPLSGLSAARKLVALIQRYRLQERVIVQSYYPETLYQVSALDSAIATQLLAFLPDEHSGQALIQLAKDKKLHSLAIVMPAAALDSDFVQQAQLAGVRIFSGLANTMDSITALLKLKVDSIITDYPACVMKLQQRFNNAKVTPAGVDSINACPEH